jgi:hypothetical protein
VEVLPVTAESFRLIIVVLALIWTVALVLFLVVSFIAYRRLGGIRASIMKAVAESKEAAKALMHIAALIDVVRSGIDLISKISETMKGGKQDEHTTGS